MEEKLTAALLLVVSITYKIICVKSRKKTSIKPVEDSSESSSAFKPMPLSKRIEESYIVFTVLFIVIIFSH